MLNWFELAVSGTNVLKKAYKNLPTRSNIITDKKVFLFTPAVALVTISPGLFFGFTFQYILQNNVLKDCLFDRYF